MGCFLPYMSILLAVNRLMDCIPVILDSYIHLRFSWEDWGVFIRVFANIYSYLFVPFHQAAYTTGWSKTSTLPVISYHHICEALEIFWNVKSYLLKIYKIMTPIPCLSLFLVVAFCNRINMVISFLHNLAWFSSPFSDLSEIFPIELNFLGWISTVPLSAATRRSSFSFPCLM